VRVTAVRDATIESEGNVVNITIDSVTRIDVSSIGEYDYEEEDDEEEESYYRTITIETASGEVIEIDLNATAEENLEVIEEEEEE
jgi:hypothetical protein